MNTSITQTTLTQMVEHLQDAYPNEGGGLLLGTMQGDLATVLEIAPAHNTFPTEEQFHRMGLATDFWTQIEDSADARGLQIVGFYHSHPDHPAQPSLYDLEHAWVNMAYIIVSVQAGKLDHIRNWQLKPDRSAFEEITLTAVE